MLDTFQDVAACSARRPNPVLRTADAGGSPVLLAMGYGPEEAAAGVRLSLGPWLQPADLAAVPEAFAQAIADLQTA
jgi:cysteine sulfinate desulfinase/cysteine desulfurase-like protein